MCTDAIFYSGMQFWSYYDDNVTSNTLSFDFFTYQTNKQAKLNSPKVKFVIYTKSNSSISATLTSCELYKYLYNFKKVIIDKLGQHQKEILKSKDYTDGFCHHLYKNNIYTTIMYNSNLDSSCIRFMIGEKESLILDTDKVYVPLVEFLSLYKIAENTFNNFPVLSCNVMQLDFIKKFDENVKTSIENLNYKIDNLSVVKEKPKITTAHDVVESILDEEDEKDENVKVTKTTEIPSEEESFGEVVESKDQNEFDDFLKEKRDTFDLDLPKDSVLNVNQSKTEDVIYEDKFVDNVLKKNFKNLEMIVSNAINTELPVETFTQLVNGLSNIDLYRGFTDQDICSINYIISRNLKFYINRYIQKKIDFPKNITPIILKDLNFDSDNEDEKNKKIEVMYFLILSYIYLSKIKAQLSEKITSANDNKEFFAYCLKTITSPFVFTYLIRVNKNVLTGYISNLYYRLRKDGFFNEFEKDIFEKTRIQVDVSCNYIVEQLEKIYDKMISVKDKISIDNFFNTTMVLKYKDFDGVKYSHEMLSKIIVIERYFHLKKLDSLYNDIKSTDDVPVKILNKYGLKNTKFDNNIIVRFFQERLKDFKDIEQIKKINVNVQDILKDINIQCYPLEALKALYFWDVNRLPKNITYDGFLNIIENCNIPESSLISMIVNNKYKLDNDFYRSLIHE